MDNNEAPRISCEELKQLLEKGERPIIIDTRSSSLYNTEHIEGAINIHYDPAGYAVEREFMLSALPQDTLLVCYCD